MVVKRGFFLRRKLKYALFLVFPLLLWIMPTTGSSWTGQVVHVADGDTITVMRDDERVRIRLYGIDAPESDQPFGGASTRFVAAFVDGATVQVEKMDKDHYGRVVGIIHTEDGHNLNKEIVRAGLAWVYNRYCRIGDCDHWRDLEAQARQDKIGLWAAANPVEPWDWRRH